MSDHLNKELYTRFGLTLDIQKVQNGFKKYLKKKIIDSLCPIIFPSAYEPADKLYLAQCKVFEEVCRQFFLDVDRWDNPSYNPALKQMIESELSDKFTGSFDEYLVRLQILLNVIAKNNLLSFEVNELAQAIDAYFNDFPLLGLTIKIYKQKAPQVFPTTSKKFAEEIKNTLGLLETDKKYNDVLSHFESGLKEFLTAKTQAGYKDVIEDMFTSCDVLVKSISNDHGKGFQHISDKDISQVLKLNNHQKELFKNLRNWMNDIKHGTQKEFDRNDVEMIISMTGSLIRFTILKQK